MNYEKTPVKDAVFVKSSPDFTECPPPEIPEVAFIGRSNVGKSSLINMLTKRKNLAKISGKPGKTRLINHFLINKNWHLVDLPGYGWAKVGKKERTKWDKMIKDYFLRREGLSCVFVLIDVRHDPLEQDLTMINWLGENGLPLALVFTKCDKLGKAKTDASVALFQKTLLESWETLPPIFRSSATNGEGKEEILAFIRHQCMDI